MPSPSDPSPVSWTPWIDPAASSKYQGIFEAIQSDILSGVLQPGDALPAQRTVAAALGVDLTTVTKAYSQARRANLTQASSGRGTFVAATAAAEDAQPARPPLLDLSKNSPPRALTLDISRTVGREIERAFQSADTGWFNYQETGGGLQHRLAGQAWLARRLPGITAQQIVLASGAQSALFAACHLLCTRTRRLAVGQYTYPGIHTVARELKLALLPLPSDAQGIVPATFESACQDGLIDALYLVPNIDNPTTATLSAERRQQLATAAQRHGVGIIEDDPYSDFVPDRPAAMAALAPAVTWHIATLSKCATPALRLAYVVAPDAAGAHQMAAALQATTMMTSPFFAALATQWINSRYIDKVSASIRTENAARIAIAREVFTDLPFAAHPTGPHIWLPLPPGWTSTEFALQAERHHILVLPSSSFVVGPPAAHQVQAARISLGAAADHATLRAALAALRGILAALPRAPFPAIV